MCDRRRKARSNASVRRVRYAPGRYAWVGTPRACDPGPGSVRVEGGAARPQRDGLGQGNQLPAVAALGLGDPLFSVTPSPVQLGLQLADLGLELQHPPHSGQVQALVGEL